MVPEDKKKRKQETEKQNQATIKTQWQQPHDKESEEEEEEDEGCCFVWTCDTTSVLSSSFGSKTALSSSPNRSSASTR